MKNLCIFASYSADSVVHEYVLCLLKAIQADLSCDIVFVTTSDQFSDDMHERVKPYVLKASRRDNKAYDFGSYIDGLKSVENWEGYEHVFLINDSIYGPLFPFADCYNQMSQSKCDVWGLSESHDRSYHLQSYFLCFKPSAYASLAGFIESYQYPDRYWDVVTQGEIGLSQHLLKEGLNLLSYVSMEAAISSSILRKRELKGYILMRDFRYKLFFNYFFMANGIFDFWYDSIVVLKCPVIKVKLLSDQKFYRQHFSMWTEIDMPAEVRDAIRMHLAHTRKFEKYDVKLSLFEKLINPRRWQRFRADRKQMLKLKCSVVSEEE